MRGTFEAEGQFTSAPTQINVEDFNITEDYRSTPSSCDGTSFVCTTVPMSASRWTIENHIAQPETNTMMPPKLISISQCESPSSLNLYPQHTTISPHDCNSVLSLPVQQSMMKVAQLPKNRSRTDIRNRAYCQKPFHNSEKDKNSYKRTRSPSSFSSTSNYDIIGDSHVPLSPPSCMAGTYLTPHHEVLPVLHLLRYPVEIAFPDRISCVISKRPDRLGVLETSQLVLSAPNSPNNLPLNEKRTVPNTSKEPPENDALKIEVPCWKICGDEKKDPLL